ncbi:MAG: hypothetical protein KA974_04535 [Saprospiraceae bacterium]|nr:hypothetical protein [Saprospiraceae bacterium]MBP7699761.1 hypothetical protein [Saprospiraceae bacterium]
MSKTKHIDTNTPKAIRNQYADMGVDAFYEKYGGTYTNPHHAQIVALLAQNEHRLDYNNVLDFCAGGGEVTKALTILGYKNVYGADPFTHELYEQQTKLSCYRDSFDDVVKQQAACFEYAPFSSIICSFAMHLCPQRQLYSLAFELLQHTKSLVIITPHKRPALEQYATFTLLFEDFAFTARQKKVYLKTYITH